MRTKAVLIGALVCVFALSGEAIGKKTIKTYFQPWGHSESSGQVIGVFGWIDSQKRCEKKRKIVLFKKRAKGKDKRLAQTRTGALLHNRFQIDKKLKPGRYYLRAPKKKLKRGLFCGAAKSKVRKLR